MSREWSQPTEVCRHTGGSDGPPGAPPESPGERDLRHRPCRGQPCGARRRDRRRRPYRQELPIGELLLLGVATSIDALAVGSLAFLDVRIASTVTLIGVTAFVLSLAGVYVGHRVGTRVRTPAEVAGVVLVATGTKVLLDHLGVW